jgi:copper chaperone
MKQELIAIEGMHCNGCVRSVTNALKRVEGVTEVEVSLEEKRARVTFDEVNVAFADLRTAVQEAGYSATEYAAA